MEKAEYLLAARQRNSESVLSESVNGEGHVPSPVPSENPQEALPLSADPDRTPSPNMVPSHNKHHCIKKVCKKKKKCLSDIFGHIVASSKESSTVNVMADKFHATTHALREEPKDSPYADLDSVPMLHRPKRTAMPPIQDADRLVRKEPCSAKAKTKFTEKVTDSCHSSSSLPNESKETNSKHSLGTCKKLSHSSTEKHSMNFPASCRLMTRALKTEEDADLIDALATSQMSTAAHTANSLDNTPTYTPIKTEPFPHWECSSSASSPTNHSSPKRRARKPDKKLIRNGSLIQSKCVDSSVSTEQPVKIKTEAVVPDLVLSFPSPSLPSVHAFQDVKELMFRSLAKEDSSDSELTAFRPDSNYKFSTFLMLLKDIHDTREKEGKPMTLPPSPVLIKEEPLVIPTSTGGHMLNGSCDGFTQSIKKENGQSEKSTTPHNSAVKTKNRTKAIMAAETYNCKDFSVHSHIRSSDKQRRKQKLPAKLKLSIPGLSSDLADLAYGREFVSGHADLADPGSGSPVTTDPLVPYFGKNSESTVAPKKRWQLVEQSAENKDEVVREVSADISGPYTTATAEDLDLGVEKQAENDSNCSESSSTAGKTQATDVNIVHRNGKMIKKVICIL